VGRRSQLCYACSHTRPWHSCSVWAACVLTACVLVLQLAGEYAMKVESLQEAVWGSAIPRLITVMVLGVAMLMLHWLTLFLWGRVGFLKARCVDGRLQVHTAIISQAAAGASSSLLRITGL